MFEKAHIVFWSNMIIDTMIVNRLKHRFIITNGTIDQQNMSYYTQ